MKTDFESWVKKLALGTVQFGLDYGISNPAGRVKPAEVASILAMASGAGIDMLDTAISYGESEASIGKAMAETDTTFDIVSKIPPGIRPEQVREVVMTSLQRTQKKKFRAFLTHDSNLYKRKEIRRTLADLKHEGFIRQSGLSVYHPREITWLLDRGIGFDIVQLPFSVFDRRFEPLFPLLKEKNVEIHVRSVFLQGLFFMDTGRLPGHFNIVKDKLISLKKLARENGLSLPAVLLNYAMLQREIDKVVIGVTDTSQLQASLNAFNDLNKTLSLMDLLDIFAVSDERILIPSNWKPK